MLNFRLKYLLPNVWFHENEATSKIEDLEEENLKLKVQFEDFDQNSNDLQAKMMKLNCQMI